MCHSFVQSDTPPHTNRNLKTERENSQLDLCKHNTQPAAKPPFTPFTREQPKGKAAPLHTLHTVTMPLFGPSFQPTKVLKPNLKMACQRIAMVCNKKTNAVRQTNIARTPLHLLPQHRRSFLSPPLQLCDYPPSHRHAHIAEKSSDCWLIASMKRPTLRYSASPLLLCHHILSSSPTEEHLYLYNRQSM